MAKPRKVVDTLEELPEPKLAVLYDVDGESHTLADWAKLRGIPKSTLHGRIKRGMSMSEALASTRSRKSNKRHQDFQSSPCQSFDKNVPQTFPARGPEMGNASAESASKSSVISVPRDGIEPSTRGFSRRPIEPKSAEIPRNCDPQRTPTDEKERLVGNPVGNHGAAWERALGAALEATADDIAVSLPAPGDAVEAALRDGLNRALQEERWEDAEVLTRELGARRRARAGVVELDAERLRRGR